MINIQLNIPKYQSIAYIPQIAETIKFAWVQFFSFFVGLCFIGRYFMNNFYYQGIFVVNQVNDLPKNKTSYNKCKLE